MRRDIQFMVTRSSFIAVTGITIVIAGRTVIMATIRLTGMLENTEQVDYGYADPENGERGIKYKQALHQLNPLRQSALASISSLAETSLEADSRCNPVSADVSA